MAGAVAEVFFVSAWERAYNAFTDKQGREVAGGTTRWLAWCEPGKEPTKVKVPPDVFESVSGLSTGDVIEVTHELVPAGSGQYRIAVSGVAVIEREY